MMDLHRNERKRSWGEDGKKCKKKRTTPPFSTAPLHRGELRGRRIERPPRCFQQHPSNRGELRGTPPEKNHLVSDSCHSSEGGELRGRRIKREGN